MATYCVKWVSGGQNKIECEDTKPGVDEAVTRKSVLDKAFNRMTNVVDGVGPVPPDEGTTLVMEKNAEPHTATPVGDDWHESFMEFTEECDHS